MAETAVWALSPNYSTQNFPDFPRGLTVDDKINVFQDRIGGWQIGIAKKMLEHKIEHSDIAILQILVSYFETLGIYRSGYIGRKNVAQNFKAGFAATFPELKGIDEGFMDNFLEKVRNGIYHLGLPKAGVALSCQSHRGIEYDRKTRTIVICARKLVEEVEIKFRQYVSELRNPENALLRKHFAARFDFDHSPETR